jgi:thiamine-phosphate pyrophosphorylase
MRDRTSANAAAEVTAWEVTLGTFERLRLARAAAALNRRGSSCLPSLVLMTDDERLPDPLAAARALPRGSMVVVRARQSAHRAKLARALQPIARARRLTLLIANDPALADQMCAAGAHFSETNAREAACWRARRPNWLITVAAHSLQACAAARRAHADAVLFGPVFATASHPKGKYFGMARARTIARTAPLPTYALGGIAPGSAGRLAESPFIGLAAIAAFVA